MRLQAQPPADGAPPDVIITEIGGTVGDIESAAVHRVGPPGAPRARPQERVLRARLARAVHGRVGRAEDQADPALGRRAALHRHPAGCARAAQRPPGLRVQQAQDRAHVRRRRAGRRQRGRRAEHLRHPDDAARAGPRRLHHRAARPRAGARGRLGRLAASCSTPCTTPSTRSRSAWSASTSTCPTPTSRSPRRCKAGGFAAPDQGQRSAGSPPTSARRPRAPRKQLADVDGICVPGGFGVRGIEGKLGALHFARENGIPALGLCLGLQCMVIEYARNVAGLAGRILERVRPRHRVPGDRDDGRAGRDHRRRRPGRHDAPRPLRGRARSRARSSQSCTARRRSSERHRHRYEVNNHYRDQIADAGLVFSGISPDRDLVEYVELPRDVHPFYVGTQAHPELRSRPNRRAPAVPRPGRRGARAPAGQPRCSRCRAE